MTPDQQALLAELRELNAKRTQGEWENGAHPGNPRINMVRPIFFGKYVGKLPECEGGAIYMLHEANAAFIASAPRMMQLIEGLAAENARLREASAWQPIETAPRDGTEIMLATDYPNESGEYRVTIGHFLTGEERLIVVGYSDDHGLYPECPEYDDDESISGDWTSWDGGFTYEHPPTHWKPLQQHPRFP